MNNEEKNKGDKKQEELAFNKNNREYTERLMDESGSNTDDYWDSKSPFVRLILLILLVIIVIGSIWVFGSYFS